MRPIQRHDTSDPTKLYEYLTELEDHIRQMGSTTSKQQDHINKLDKQVRSIPPPIQSLDTLPGIAVQPQNPRIPRVDRLPDPHNTNLTHVVLTGTPDSLYWLDDSALPKRWRKIADLP